MKAYVSNTNAMFLKRVYQALLRSTLLMPVQSPVAKTAPGEVRATRLKQNTEVAYLTTTNRETGESVLLAFTDQRTMAAYNFSGQSFVGLPTNVIFQHLSPDEAPPLVICTPDGALPLSREVIRQLAAGKIPLPNYEGVIPGGTELRVSPLDRPLPAELQQAIRAAAATCDSVIAVYVFRLQADNKPPENAVAVVFSMAPQPAVARPLLDEIARLLKPHFPAGDDLIAMPIAVHTEPAKQISRAVTAVYQR